MYWVPYVGTDILEGCWGGDNYNKCYSGIYYNGMCALQLGAFEQGDNFETAAKSHTHQDFNLKDKTDSEEICTKNMIASASEFGQAEARLFAKGHVENAGQGQVKVSESLYYLDFRN